MPLHVLLPEDVGQTSCTHRPCGRFADVDMACTYRRVCRRAIACPHRTEGMAVPYTCFGRHLCGCALHVTACVYMCTDLRTDMWALELGSSAMPSTPTTTCQSICADTQRHVRRPARTDIANLALRIKIQPRVRGSLVTASVSAAAATAAFLEVSACFFLDWCHDRHGYKGVGLGRQEVSTLHTPQDVGHRCRAIAPSLHMSTCQ